MLINIVLLWCIFVLARSANIVVIGATGKLGSVIVKQALAIGHDITAVIRDRSKLKLRFEQHEIASMHIIVADTSDTSEDNLYNFKHAFTGQDLVIEAISNTQRPTGIEMLITAAERTGLPAFLVCGGAGILFESKRADAKRVYETLHNKDMSWMTAVSELHLEVQKVAFESSVPVVSQFCPPGMEDGVITTKAQPTENISLGVWSMSYQDVAAVLLEVINLNPSHAGADRPQKGPGLEVYNRKMIGFKLKKQHFTILKNDGTVRGAREMGMGSRTQESNNKEHKDEL